MIIKMDKEKKESIQKENLDQYVTRNLSLLNIYQPLADVKMCR